MQVEILKSKIHRATVTDANLNYEGSNGWFYDVVDKQFCDSDNDAVREIVYDWYTGTDEYKAKYSKEDYDRASSIILTLVSMGLG